MSVQRESPDVATESRFQSGSQSITPESFRISDSDLLAQISQGDPDALGALYDRHIEAVWKIALHYSASAAAAEEVVSAVFLRLWRNPEPNDKPGFSARLLSSVARDSQQAQRGQRMSASARDHEESLMAAVNQAIDRVHSSLDLADSDFYCECGLTWCKERITLSRAQYAGLLEDPRPLLAAAHAYRENAAETELRTLRGQVHQLQGTLASRVEIEQAKGILAERGDLTMDDAFEILRHAARQQKRSLAEICAEYIAGVGIPDDETASSAASRQSLESHER
ncbi:MAG: ANTAR domain-containing protein [Candidatus Limnocylindrales bacterium]